MFHGLEAPGTLFHLDVKVWNILPFAWEGFSHVSFPHRDPGGLADLLEWGPNFVVVNGINRGV